MPFTEPEHCVLRPQFNKPEPQAVLLGPNRREQRDKEEVALDLERAGLELRSAKRWPRGAGKSLHLSMCQKERRPPLPREDSVMARLPRCADTEEKAAVVTGAAPPLFLSTVPGPTSLMSAHQ